MDNMKRRMMTTSERVDVLVQYINYIHKFVQSELDYKGTTVKSLDQFIQDGYEPHFRDEGIK